MVYLVSTNLLFNHMNAFVVCSYRHYSVHRMYSDTLNKLTIIIQFSVYCLF